MTDDRPKFLRDAVSRIGEDLCGLLGDVAVRTMVVGSVRRGKRLVGDLEVLVIPRYKDAGVDLLGAAMERVNLAKVRLEEWVAGGRIAKRVRADGRALVGWGEQNCFAVHTRSGVPIDVFFATEENWISLLVCRTGPAGLNVVLCQEALKRGLRWDPYQGIIGPAGLLEPVAHEAAFFGALGVPYLVPEQRCLLLNEGVRNDPDRRASLQAALRNLNDLQEFQDIENAGRAL